MTVSSSPEEGKVQTDLVGLPGPVAENPLLVCDGWTWAGREVELETQPCLPWVFGVEMAIGVGRIKKL